jgi:nucleotide-binding universal stress UspA family protein
MTIIASVDRDEEDSERIVAEGIRLGAAFEEPVHVVHVLNKKEFVGLQRTSVNDTGQAVPVERIKRIATEIATEAIGDRGDDADCEAIGLVGKPAEEIVNYADTHDASYIVIGGRKRSAVGKALFGSVAQSILFDSQSPVVVAGRPSE